MSTKYPGGFITKSPVAPTTTAASGVWTLDQQQQYQKAGTWPSPPIFIEDLFSTYLYTGNGSTQTITNGIDLSTKGGMVWIKGRSAATFNNLYDTTRGIYKRLVSNTTDAEATTTSSLTSFNSDGFSSSSYSATNGSGTTYASWTFRKQPKFFDVVTYTGNGTSTNVVSHTLASQPAFIITKQIDSVSNWVVWHRTGTSWVIGYLNTTGSMPSAGSINSSVTSTQVNIGSINALSGEGANLSGGSYVMYLFASDAGGFPASGAGSTNGISCGSFTYTAGTIIDLGYEPQAVLFKTLDTVGPWYWLDNMRGWTTSGDGVTLSPNTSAAESAFGAIGVAPTATGFRVPSGFGSGANYIYIAIRRGPMKTPTTGTSVFDADAYTGNSTARVITTGFPSDLNIMANRTSDGLRSSAWDRLRGYNKFLATSSASIDVTYADEAVYFDNNNGYGLSTSTSQGLVNFSGYGGYVGWAFRRAPSFFDEVCYTGTGVARTISHNLGVAPELMIVKARESAGGAARNWAVYSSSLGAGTQAWLNTTDAAFASTTIWGNTSPTASVFSVSTNVNTNYSAVTYVAYLFATCAGVSKVGSYTGTGTTQQINCGFTGGARFVLIKRTSTGGGDWYVWDSARGIVAGNDPYLLMNSTAAEVANTDYVDTYSAGFEISSTAPADINASGGTFIFLAIA